MEFGLRGCRLKLVEVKCVRPGCCPVVSVVKVIVEVGLSPTGCELG